jgi:hypothetical protein
LIGLVGVTGLLLGFWFGPARAAEPIQIFNWVADEMQINSVPSMPKILFVEKKVLQTVFINGNHKSYLRWEAEYGEAQAQRILNKYLEGVLGLFVPQTETIYVETSLPPCRRQAILAHEITHYFQHKIQGVISPDKYGADLEHLVREMHAYKIENKYTETFCSKPLP